MAEITLDEYKQACELIKAYRIQEQQKRLVLEIEASKWMSNPNIESIKKEFDIRLYYHLLTYFRKTPGYYRLEPNLKVSDLEGASMSLFYAQKNFGKKLQWQLEKICKKYNITMIE